MRGVLLFGLLLGCFVAFSAGLAEAGHQRGCRRLHSGEQERGEGWGAAFGSQDAMSIIRFKQKMAETC